MNIIMRACYLVLGFIVGLWPTFAKMDGLGVWLIIFFAILLVLFYQESWGPIWDSLKKWQREKRKY